MFLLATFALTVRDSHATCPLPIGSRVTITQVSTFGTFNANDGNGDQVDLLSFTVAPVNTSIDCWVTVTNVALRLVENRDESDFVFIPGSMLSLYRGYSVLPLYVDDFTSGGWSQNGDYRWEDFDVDTSVSVGSSQVQLNVTMSESLWILAMGFWWMTGGDPTLTVQLESITIVGANNATATIYPVDIEEWYPEV